MTKSLPISKRMVYESYLKVVAKDGSAGIDKQSIELFNQDLSNNLYKLWNRMSSGSYFPPPVRTVFIPKKSGGMRPLGIPTVSDRIAQGVVKDYLEPRAGNCKVPYLITIKADLSKFYFTMYKNVIAATNKLPGELVMSTFLNSVLIRLRYSAFHFFADVLVSHKNF